MANDKKSLAKSRLLKAFSAAIKARNEADPMFLAPGAIKAHGFNALVKALASWYVDIIKWEGMNAITATNTMKAAGQYPEGYVPSDSARVQVFHGIMSFLSDESAWRHNAAICKKMSGSTGYSLSKGQSDMIAAGKFKDNPLNATYKVAQAFYAFSGLGRKSESDDSAVSKRYSSDVRRSDLVSDEDRIKPRKSSSDKVKDNK